MPSHRVHAYLDRLYFGRVYWRVHRGIDSAYPYFGRGHGIFGHDPISAYLIASECYPGDPDAQTSAILQIDCLCSSNPVFHRFLELEAGRMSKRRRSRRKRWEMQNPPKEIKDFIVFCRKLVEYRKLARIVLSWDCLFYLSGKRVCLTHVSQRVILVTLPCNFCFCGRLA